MLTQAKFSIKQGSVYKMPKNGLVERVKNASFRLFGKRIPTFPVYKQSYQKSGIGLIYESYMAVMLFSCVLSFVLTFAVGMFLNCFLFKIPVYMAAIAAISLSVVSMFIVLISYIARPLWLIKQRRAQIDSSLIYTVGYMGVLSAGGLPIERVFTRVVEVEPRPAIRELATRFVANVRMFGMDVASSLDDVRLHSPSRIFAKLLLGVMNTIKTSGDLKSLLVFETKRLLTLKREQLKKTLSALIALSELYVTAMVMAPITFIIMLTILSVLGTSQFGMSPAMQLNLIVFLGIPAICILFIVLLDGLLPKED
jgi:archaellum biogenesis protein FlaJ (TadC family)